VRVPGPDGKLDQFAHASSIQIATPQGRLAQYYLGVEYSPKDVLVARVVQLGGIVTVASLGGFIFLMFRRDIKLSHQEDSPLPDSKNRRKG
jgi:protein SCO1/2